jgi:hypothetical protein
MPISPPKPCSQPGCGALVHDGTGRCALHPKASGYNKIKLSRHQRGYGYAWEKLRAIVLRRDGGLCVPCKSVGVFKVGNSVDHIIPKSQGGDDSLENLQTICKACHTVKTAFESAAGKSVALPGWLPKASIPVHVVCGPAGAGKSSYVVERARSDELVLDLDEIAAKLSGLPLYGANFETIMAAIRVRNKLLASLADTKCAFSAAWLIVAAGSPSKRAFWEGKYGAVHIMQTSKDECVRRIQQDDRRPEAIKAKHIASVYAWC